MHITVNFDRPEVAKLRGHSGGDPREKSEVIKEQYETRFFGRSRAGKGCCG
nr:MAG TPA: hypothetical protein [Caudoviricetes sp.]